MLINVLLKSKMTASKAKEIIKIYPQVLVNAKVSNDNKMDYAQDSEIKTEEF